MKRSTNELYGIVPRDILETRNSLAKYFISAAKKKIIDLNEVAIETRDNRLIDDCLKAVEHWERLNGEVYENNSI